MHALVLVVLIVYAALSAGEMRTIGAEVPGASVVTATALDDRTVEVRGLFSARRSLPIPTGAINGEDAQQSGPPSTRSYAPVQPVIQVGDSTAGQACFLAVFDTAAEVAVADPVTGVTASQLPDPFCPEEASAAATTALPAPEDFALQFWEQVQLPAPSPTIAPGFAVTGKTAFLESGARPTASYQRETPLGTLVIEATAELWVDWGDGTGVQGPYSTLGDPWPGGEITNVYRSAGTVDVTVTQQWTARWALAGASGTLGGLTTTATIPDFAIQQLQPVLQ